ncbi:MAG: hypothetical protein RL763_677 [Pseudomonadota bacterium]
MKTHDLRFNHLKRTVIGGSACPPAMIHAFNDLYGVEVLHAWGMTELSPLGTLSTLKNKHLSLSDEDKMKIRMKQGRQNENPHETRPCDLWSGFQNCG